MNPLAFIVALAAFVTLALPAWSGAEAAPVHRAVFELTTNQESSWNGLLNNLENLHAHYGPEQTAFEVVAHGPGIGFVLKTHTAGAERMAALARNGVVFAACQNTMTRQQISREALLPFVTVVPAGVAEILAKQEAGWSYIKAGH